MTLDQQMLNVQEKAQNRQATYHYHLWCKNNRHIYLGYIRSIIEYNFSPPLISSKTNIASFDKVESNALHFIKGAMRTTPTAACHIHNNIWPLEIRKEATVLGII